MNKIAFKHKKNYISNSAQRNYAATRTVFVSTMRTRVLVIGSD